jgi:hypothetical protein
MTINLNHKAYIRLIQEVEKGKYSQVISAAVLQWFVQLEEYAKIREDRVKEGNE